MYALQRGTAVARRLSASTSTPARSVSHCRAILSRAVPDRERAPSMVATAPLLGTIFLAQEASAASNFEFTGYAGASSSFWTVLGLFVMSVPGLWSIIKRATKSTPKRRVYEVDGPATDGAKQMDDWAKDIARYFIKYNYAIVGTGEVITFEGTYQASVSQAFALSSYTLFSLAATALVLSTLFPEIGNWWYAMCLISPAAGWYYWSRGTRNEQCKVKMVASDDDKTIDIIVEGDQEELDRFAQELNVVEKGKERVKGLLEA